MSRSLDSLYLSRTWIESCVARRLARFSSAASLPRISGSQESEDEPCKNCQDRCSGVKFEYVAQQHGKRPQTTNQQADHEEACRCVA
jgi:hypothetical protein